MAKMESISSPHEFYEMLLNDINSARFNITLSALYVGVSKPHERKLIQALEDCLEDATRPKLQVRLILDYSRARRDNTEFMSRFRALLTKYHPRLKVYLYEMPSQRRSGSWSSYFKHHLPPQVREVLGVYHCKFMIFDNEAIVTGSNLSEDYYVDRQDRYYKIHFEPVIQYLNSFASIIIQDCHVLLPDRIEYCPNGNELVRTKLMQLNKDFDTSLKHCGNIGKFLIC
jgi:CDP-diacylglycerol--glycerol-3-phosphate 3-phosphatidyltransferase